MYLPMLNISKIANSCYFIEDYSKHLIKTEKSTESDMANVSYIRETLFFVQLYPDKSSICRIPNRYGHGVLNK